MKQLSRASKSLRSRFKRWSKARRLWFTVFSVTGGVVLLRLGGLLQGMELTALDQLMRLRPLPAQDDRIVIVTISDADIDALQTWPIPDRVMVTLLKQIRAAQPRAIGLDVYRDVPVGQGQAELEQVWQTTPNLIGIEKIADSERPGIAPPPGLPAEQIGFNNVVVDLDTHVRRSVLYWQTKAGVHRSFGLQLALRYLEAEGISLQRSPHNPEVIQLGQSTLQPLTANEGGYVGVDAGGFQILAAPRPIGSYRTISMTDVLSGNGSASLMRDRIVLIGSTAASLRDYFYTAYSAQVDGNAQATPGVELHAQFISQLLDATSNPNVLIRGWTEPIEWLWIGIWSWLGAMLSCRTRSPGRLVLGNGLLAGGLAGSSFGGLLLGWWLPLVPALLGLTGSTLLVIGYRAYQQEELKKSREFLHSVINTIPDPVYVKDQQHRWIVLNEAYCRFSGYPQEQLLDRSDYDILPAHQAKLFWQQDEQVFTQEIEQESEEEFTAASGITYRVATKRSLHKDAAGNVFLVGVIRDITQRKQVEEELRRTAAELVQSNAELQRAKDHLARMAYYDPLTGLPNRKLLNDRLEQALNVQRTEELTALLFLDLDGFKSTNDTYGHGVGDLLLKAVAQRLIGCLRSSDMVARLGGDEFVVLLPIIAALQDVERVAEKLLATLSQNFALAGHQITVSASIGISIYPDDGHEKEELLMQADSAMYSAKKLGKNRYVFYSRRLSTKS